MALEFNTNLIKVASNFLQILDIRISKTSLKTLLITNPYYPSLYSLSDVFNKFNIDNKGLQIKNEELDDLPVPFLAYITIKEIGAKDFVNVTNVTKDSITYTYKKEETIAKPDFIEKWSNIVFVAQSNEKTKDIDFEKNREIEINKRNRSIILTLGFGLILLSGIFHFIKNSNEILQSLTFVTLTSIGLSAAILLLIHEVDKSNAFVKNICEGGVKTNCDAVLSSDASKIFNISWSELGFFYFGFLMMYLLIPFVSYEDKKPFITGLSILTAMYIPFSIYYQYKIVKQWCRLCLMVQVILFLQLIWAVAYGSLKFQLNAHSIIFFVICALLPMLVWYALKPMILKALDSEKHFASYKRLFTNPDIFNVIISEQADAPEGWEKIGIHKGNENASNILIKVCSPTCQPCAKAHRTFNEILEFNSDLKIITIYEVDSEDDTDFRRMFVTYMLALSEFENGKNLQNAMDYWYLNADREFDIMVAKYPVTFDLLQKQNKKIEDMLIWCKSAEIQYTPTVYLNGKKLARDIHIEELKNIL